MPTPMSAEKSHDTKPLAEARCLLTELFGTFALTFVGAGAIVIQELSAGELTYVARVAALGLIVMALIYALGNVSGAHINPAVTFAFALRGSFEWARVPGYIIMQLLGALTAAGTLYALFGAAGHVGANIPHYGILQSFVMEIILTTFLVTVIIGTATGHRVVGPNAGIAVGATIIMCGLFADPVSGSSMNPARSIGPGILGGQAEYLWLYIVGPLIGASMAVVLNFAIQGKPNPHEAEAAGGEGEKSGEPSES
jgi:aquaporin Z